MGDEQLIMNFDTTAVLEIKIRANSKEWSKVDPWIFRSWTGVRRVNGQRIFRPVYFLGSNEVARD